MKKIKARRLVALNAFGKFCDIEMNILKVEDRMAREQLESIERDLFGINQEMRQIEEQLRAELDCGHSVSVDNLRGVSEYLQKKHQVHLNKERQRHYAEKQCGDTNEKIKQQQLKISGLDKVKLRKIREFCFEIQKQQGIELDEAWLQRQGVFND